MTFRAAIFEPRRWPKVRALVFALAGVVVIGAGDFATAAPGQEEDRIPEIGGLDPGGQASPPSGNEAIIGRPRPRLLPPPFQEGERALYDIRFGLLRAGSITLEIGATSGNAGSAGEGDGFWKFRGRARSSKLISPFYRADDAFESLVDRRSFLPNKLTITVDESREAGFRFVEYDHGGGVAHYRRQRTHHKKHGPSDDRRQDPLAGRAQDVFSALFLLRRVDLAPGDVFYVPVYDNGKNWDARVEVFPPEKVSTGLGKKSGYRLTMQVELEGKLSAEKDYTIWIGTNERRLLLRWEAGLRFGSLRGVLRRYQAEAEAGEEGRAFPDEGGWMETP